jgi:hypothetical protein
MFGGPGGICSGRFVIAGRVILDMMAGEAQTLVHCEAYARRIRIDNQWQDLIGIRVYVLSNVSLRVEHTISKTRRSHFRFSPLL